MKRFKPVTPDVRKIAQYKIIEDLAVKAHINAEEEVTKRVNFLKNFLVNSKSKGYVLGISGGQDSTLTGWLAQQAVNQLRKETGEDYKFVAMRLPYGVQKDEDDAQLALSFIQPDVSVTFDIKPTVDAFKATYDAADEALTDYHKGNVKARARMVTQYAYAGMHNMLVLGTDWAGENLMGFYTKYGDGGVDLIPLNGLNKRQGKALLQFANAPEVFYTKSPTADLLDNSPGQTDEYELGISYDVIDNFLEGKDIDPEVHDIIVARYYATMHKRVLPFTPPVD